MTSTSSLHYKRADMTVLRKIIITKNVLNMFILAGESHPLQELNSEHMEMSTVSNEERNGKRTD